MSKYAITVFVPALAIDKVDCPFGSNEGGWFILAAFDHADSARLIYLDMVAKKRGELRFKGYEVAACALEPYELAREADLKSLGLLGVKSQLDLPRAAV